MIQDIFPHQLKNQFQPDRKPEPGDFVCCFSGGKLLCGEKEGAIVFPRVGDFPETEHLVYLFDLDGQAFFLCREEKILPPDGFAFATLHSLRNENTRQKEKVFAAVTAGHLYDWYRSHIFCGCCGKEMLHSKQERAMVCPACGRVYYPRINPAVIVGVTNGEELLLTKYAGRGHSYYALVAGFTEIGETFEETVKREVMEETGLSVTNIRYYKSQPWGFAADILAGYYCDVAGDPTIRVDHVELKEALWMRRENVPGQPDDFSLTNEMMCAFRDGLV